MNKFRNILDKEGLNDWVIKICKSGGGLCLYNSKTILLDKKYENDIAMFLHEVAHALTPKHHHDVVWGDKYTLLVKKHLINKH